MGITTYTRAAKCKDCKFCIPYKKGNIKRHYCDKIKLTGHGKDIRLNDLVCEEWKL